MTAKQLFNLIDKADDKFLKEALEDEIQYPMTLTPELDQVYGSGTAAKAKRRFPIKPLAACAACLAVILGLTFIGNNINKIDPLFGKPARGVISKIAEKDMICYDAVSGIDFGNFSYTIDRFQTVTSSDKLYAANQTAVSADLKLNISFSEYGYPHDNVTARVFLLTDGKPADFTVPGTDDTPSWYKDFTLKNSELNYSTYHISDTFNIEFNASSENEQFTAVVNFFPDEVFDMQDSVAHNRLSYLTAAQSVRNSAAKVSYDYGDYKPESLDEFRFYEIYVIYTEKNITQYYGNNEKIYALNKNLNGQAFVNKDMNTAFRQYFILDGMLLNCFGNEYIKELDCHGGEYFELIEPGSTDYAKFTVPGGFLPSSGTHTISVFREPIIPESYEERVTCSSGHVITAVFAENLKDLQNEADKFNEEGVTWCNSMLYSLFRVSVHTDKTTYKKGEKIKLKVTIRNYGTETARLYSPSSSAGVSMYISRDGINDDLINTDGYYLRGVTEDEPTVIDLKPGEEYNVEFNFDTMIEKDGKRIKAPEGQYSGSLVYQFWESRDAGNGHTYTYLSNRTVDFKIYI